LPPGSDSQFPRPFGRYTLLDRVAAGGMAELFLAVERTPHAGGRFVMIKRIRDDLHDEPDFIEFFLTEARVSLKCAHPNLPQVHELGRADGHYYLAMEYIRGHDMLTVLRASALNMVPLSVRAALTIGIGVAGALEHAHGLREIDGASLEVVHRDVSPQNVLVSTAGSVKLIDFGVVRSSVAFHHTRTGVLKGKLSYMAPEQLEGSGRLDHRADLFALGILLHESLCARPLFRGRDDTDTAERIRSMPIPDPSRVRDDVPVGLADVILRCLERDADRRYASAGELLEALDHIAEACGLAPTPVALRRETAALCGEPPLPHPGGRMATPPEPRTVRATRDPALLYFLRRAGAPDEDSDPQRQAD
jgi:eukaryotic-like serine/threonine-protein kinase